MSRARKIALVVIALLMICVSCGLVSLLLPGKPAEERPAPTWTSRPAGTPTASFLPTARPTLTAPVPTASAKPVILPTVTAPTLTATRARATWTALPPTVPPVTVPPTSLPALPSATPPAQKLAPTVALAAPCNCQVSDYDCKDFGTQREAQACFDFCGGSASNNIWRLDGNDHDGRVCESLP